MPRNHDQRRVRTKARSSRSPRWAACTIATNAWRPEVTIVATHGSNISGSTGGVDRADSRRLAKTCSAPMPESPPLLDWTTPAQKTHLSCPATSDNIFANDRYHLSSRRGPSEAGSHSSVSTPGDWPALQGADRSEEHT